MTTNASKRPVRMAFEASTARIAIADILPLRAVRSELKATKKYTQIAASIRELGIIEPPVVARQPGADGKYLLLDGHLRIEALKDIGDTEVVCLLSTDDEAVTYNKRVSRIAIVQEHKMIMKAIERGVPEQRIATVLDVDISSLRAKVRLFNGICPEVIDMLKDKDIHMNALSILKKLLPLRQIEVVELMVAMNKFTTSYAQSLLAATPRSELVEPSKPRRIKGLTEKQMGLMQTRVCKSRSPIQADRADLRQRSPRSGTRQRLRGQAPCKCPRGEIPDTAVRGDPGRVPKDPRHQVRCRVSDGRRNESLGDPDPQARGPQETPHCEADRSRRWGWRRTRAEPTTRGLAHGRQAWTETIGPLLYEFDS